MATHERNYTTANIPSDLAERVEPYCRKLGYSNLSEFVRDAVRRRLEELEKGGA